MDVPAQLQPLAAASKFDRGELTIEVLPENILEACRIAKEQLKFERLSTVTAVDRYPSEPRFEVVYHLHSVSTRQRLRLKARVTEQKAEIDSVTPVWIGADWYEREVWDLFGIRFLNHPNLKRIMMPDDWEGYPLRRDYPVTGYK